MLTILITEIELACRDHQIHDHGLNLTWDKFMHNLDETHSSNIKAGSEKDRKSKTEPIFNYFDIH